MRYLAYIKKIDSELKYELAKSLEFIDWKRHINNNSTVFIKPNFTFPFYKKGITTSPVLIENLLSILKKRTK